MEYEYAIIFQKSARMEKHDFVYRGEFETTYSAW